MKIDAAKHTKILIAFIVVVAVVFLVKETMTEKVLGTDGRITTKFKKPSIKNFNAPMSVVQTADADAA